jgi:hypothetical protein
MRNAICSSALLLLLLHIPAEAKSKIPAELGQATYVALGYETTSGFVSENDLDARSILPQDREALDNVRQALKKWKKYIITTNPDVAEILIAVRSGRVASADGGVRVHRGSIGTTTLGGIVGAEAGPTADYLAVYDADHSGRSTEKPDSVFEGNHTQEGPVLWRGTEEGGLSGSDPSLFELLKKDVDSIPSKKKP